jgi:hypothetical protein
VEEKLPVSEIFAKTMDFTEAVLVVQLRLGHVIVDILDEPLVASRNREAAIKYLMFEQQEVQTNACG